METIGDILCFPFWPLFPPAVLAWCPTGEGRGGTEHPPHPLLCQEGPQEELPKEGGSGQMSFALAFALQCA